MIGGASSFDDIITLFSMFYDGTFGRALFLGLSLGIFTITYGALVSPAKFVIEPKEKYVVLETAYGLFQYSILSIVIATIFNMFKL